MKFLNTLILLVFIFCCNAQQTSKLLTLNAVRNNYSYSYSLGSAVKINYVNAGANSAIKGRLVKVSSEGIYISPFKKGTSQTLIATTTIFSVKKLKRKTRLVAGIVMVVSGTAGAIIGDNLESGIGTALAITAAIPAVCALYIFIGSYPFQELEKKSIKNGWVFKVQ